MGNTNALILIRTLADTARPQKLCQCTVSQRVSVSSPPACTLSMCTVGVVVLNAIMLNESDAQTAKPNVILNAWNVERQSLRILSARNAKEAGMQNSRTAKCELHYRFLMYCLILYVWWVTHGPPIIAPKNAFWLHTQRNVFSSGDCD